jgi:hypothetical protein
MMKVIIAGSRTITSRLTVKRALLESGFQPTEIVSGTARGVDQLGEDIAEGYGIPVKRMPADWNSYGKFAGYYRNKQMGNYADALVDVWDGKSKGTKQMIDYMKGLEKPVYVKDVVIAD